MQVDGDPRTSATKLEVISVFRFVWRRRRFPGFWFSDSQPVRSADVALPIRKKIALCSNDRRFADAFENDVGDMGFVADAAGVPQEFSFFLGRIAPSGLAGGESGFH